MAEALARMGQALVPDLVAVLDPELPGADVIGVLARIGPEAAAPMIKIALERATGMDMFRKRKFTAPGVSEFGGEMGVSRA